MPTPESGIPVQAVLKLVLDKQGSQAIDDFMKSHEQSWGRIEQSVSKISQGLESLTRYGLGLAGVAGIGAVVSNFFQTSQAGSNLALAAGHVTGGAGAWHPYAQSMLQAQGKTGVNASEIAQGLIQALQSVGGNPTPNQAAVLGGLLAGYGQTTGMTPGQVAQVVAPLLQAANKPLTAANLLGVGATLSGGLSAFPGSQAAPMLGLLSQLGVAQALGSGPGGGYTMNLRGLTATVNAAAQSNSIFRNPSITGGAITSISSGLQNAFGNPSQEAFMTMAGISYRQQREGFTPENMQAIMTHATALYGTGNTRDIFLRSVFGLQGADLLEQFAPGTKGASLLQQNLAHPANVAKLKSQIQHAQAATTPSATATEWAGKLLGWIQGSIPHALLAGAGVFGAGALLKKAPGAVGSLLKNLLGGGSGAEGAAAGTTAEDLLGESLLRVLGGGVSMGVGTAAAALLFPDSISVPGSNNRGAEDAVRKVVQEANKKFGRNVGSKQAQQWMWNQFGYRDPVQVGAHGQGTNVPRTSLWNMATGMGEYPHGATVAQQLLQKLFQQFSGANDPITTFSQASQALLKAAQQLSHKFFGGASYHVPGGGSQYASYLGTPAIQAMGAIAPGMEYAALTSGAGTGGGFVSIPLGGGGGSTPSNTTPAAGGGWQACTLTWYDPALGGTNSSNGAANPHSKTASGQPYSATAMTCAAPPNYPFGTQIAFAYGGQTVTCTVNDRGGAITGSHFDLSRAAANALKMIGPGKVNGKFKVISTGSGKTGTSTNPGSSSPGSVPNPSSSGLQSDFATATGAAVGGGGGSPGSMAWATGGSARQVTHVYVDSRKVTTHRILKGHRQ